MLKQKSHTLRLDYFREKLAPFSRKEIDNKVEELRLKEGATGFNRSKFFKKFDDFFANNLAEGAGP